MNWGEEFLTYQASLDEARQDLLARKKYEQAYNAGRQREYLLQNETMRRALNPFAQKALEDSVKDLVRRRVDDVAIQYVKNNITTDALNFEFNISDFGDSCGFISRVEVRLPEIRIAFHVRPPA